MSARKVEIPVVLTERQIHECLSALAIHDEDLQARHTRALDEGDKRLMEVYACRLDITSKVYARLNEALEYHERFMRHGRG